MRHGNPPKFDAAPLMTNTKIAEALGFSGPNSIRLQLSKFYAENSIEMPKREKSDDYTLQIVEMRHGSPPDFDAQPLMTQHEIAT